MWVIIIIMIVNGDSIVNYVCVSTISQPVPILDGISEHEKYGNNGDKFDGISRSLVNGYEAFSNILNAFIQVSVFLFSWTEVCASLHVALHKIIIMIIVIVCRWQLTTS